VSGGSADLAQPVKKVPRSFLEILVEAGFPQLVQSGQAGSHGDRISREGSCLVDWSFRRGMEVVNVEKLNMCR